MSYKTTKTYLKSLTHTGSSYYLRSTLRILKYGLIGFGRNIWLSITATLVMSFTLLILTITVIASVVLTTTADAMREKIDITIFFKPETTATELSNLKSVIANDQNIKSVTTATSAEEFDKFLKDSKKDKELLATLEDPEMKAIMVKTMQSTMRLKVKNPDNLTSVKQIVEHHEIFAKHLDDKKLPTYNTNNTAISTITSWANIAKNGGLALSSIFLIVSILVIFNTIRMAIYSRSEEIYMEKLVGADNRFIRGPFLVEAMLAGLLAGGLASGLSLLIFHLFAPKLKSYDIDIALVADFINSPKLFLAIAVITFTGIFIGLLSSRLAVQKYLKKI